MQIPEIFFQTSRKQEEIDKRDEELTRREEDATREKERAKVIILYMLHERKQLLSQLHQLRMRVKLAGPQAEEHETVLVAELRKQVAQLMDEKTHLQRVVDEQSNDKAVLVNIVRGLEDELNQLKEPAQNGLRKGLETPPKPIPGYVMANKSAISGDLSHSKPHSPHYNANHTGTVVRRGSPTKYRIHNSATFPTNPGPKPNGNSRYNGIPHSATSNLPRPSMGMAGRHQPPPNNRPLVQRQSRPTMGVAVQDFQHQNSTAIPVEVGKSMGLVQRFMRRSTSLPKRMNNNNEGQIQGQGQVQTPEQVIRAPPPINAPSTPPSPGLRKPQRIQQPPRPHYDNVKPNPTRIL
uniref:Lebercilin domain-containing protein n=1 Tax=Bursaphelenchus xylophilus TaxID=6326 RepID=A0A1I7SEV7_BURXY